LARRIKVTPGERFNKLSIIKEVETVICAKTKFRMVLCKCDCGNETTVRLTNLRSNHTKSCGCIRSSTTRKTQTKHGMSQTRVYRIWADIKQRCFNPKCKSYESYGARGITICDEWKDFINFYKWSKKSGYDDSLTIERIDVNGNYEPSNCKWIEVSEQNSNTSRTLRFQHQGSEKTLKEWSEYLDVNYQTLLGRIKRGWTIEDAFGTPVNKNYRKTKGVS